MPTKNVGQYYTIREVATAVIAVLSHTDPPPSPLRHDSFLDVLVEWGCTWMWDSMVHVGKYDWIEKAIYNRSCVAVTDGSYMRELYPNVFSTAFIFECTNGTGRLIGSFPETTVLAKFIPRRASGTDSNTSYSTKCKRNGPSTEWVSNDNIRVFTLAWYVVWW